MKNKIDHVNQKSNKNMDKIKYEVAQEFGLTGREKNTKNEKKS